LEQEKISIREYGRRLSVNEKSIRDAIAAGKIVKGYDPEEKKILPAIANNEWGFRHQTIKRQRGVSRAKVVEKMGAPPELPSLDAEDIEGLLHSLPVNRNMPVTEAVRLREIVGLGLDKIKLAEAEGRFVSRDKVEKALFALGSELKKALLNIPSRVVRDIMAAANEVEGVNILTDEITAVLTQYGNLNKDSF